MSNNISKLELTALNELISIANEFKSKEYQERIALLDENLKEKYEKEKPTVTYITGPADSDGHYRSTIELKYVMQEENITIMFMDGKVYWASTPKDFTEKIRDKLVIKKNKQNLINN